MMDERDRLRGRHRVACAAVALVALLIGIIVATGKPAVAAPIPLLAPVAAVDGRPVDGISSSAEEQVAFHIHAHLQVYVDGQQRALPAGVGIVAPLQVRTTAEGPFVEGGAGIYWLHTHDASGVIHIESPVHRRFTLGELFDIWGQPLGPQQVGPAQGPVTVLVDGAVVGGDPRGLILNAHDVIQLDVGAVVPFQDYRFAPGL
ncbi:MAG TPA: hypothetical protein VGE11_27595 [Pseudonocardia sp.]